MACYAPTNATFLRGALKVESAENSTDADANRRAAIADARVDSN